MLGADTMDEVDLWLSRVALRLSGAPASFGGAGHSQEGYGGAGRVRGSTEGPDVLR